MRYPKVRSLATLDAFRTHLDTLGITIPVDAEVDPNGVLSTPVEIRDASSGVLTAPNRFAVLPMEGWDGTTEGRPTDLVRRRWSRFAASGCGLVWGEATAVRRDGRANPNQLVLDEHAADDIAALRSILAPAQVAGLQLTHSGRWSRPEGTHAPRTAYRHPLLDPRAGDDDSAVLSDDELDELAETYVRAAVLARQAGFDFVDIKHCHGYLLHELLTARGRPGRYGGDLAGRTRFLRTVVEGIRRRAPDLAIAVRLSVFDFAPFKAGADGIGAPECSANPEGTRPDGRPSGRRASGETCPASPYPYAFGGDGSGLGYDLSETHALLDVISGLGIGLVCTTAGSPYYNPHIQRPAYFPPSDGYLPPEDPIVGVARQIAAASEIAVRHPGLTIVGSGYSYLQDWLPNVAQAVVAGGGASMVGLGRMTLAYPTLAADVLAGRAPDHRRLCRTFSDCTTAPRNGLVSGCYPLDPFYKQHPQSAQLAQAKKDAAVSPG